MRVGGRPAVIGIIILGACGGDAASPSATDTPSDRPSAFATASDAPSDPSSPAPSGPASAFAAAWLDVTSDEMADVGQWTNKVELADLDLDGDVDILFANGGDYESAGTPVASGAWLNNGDATFTNATTDVLGEHALLTRAIKVGDLNGDAMPDIVMGTTFGSQTRLLLSSGPMGWQDATATNLPAVELSVGDLELGDVDGDGDLDILLADWGPGNPFDGNGRMRLWRNDGSGAFVDATSDSMPDAAVGFSWEVELVDVDNDWDLDVAVSCKTCETSLLFVNDGSGAFADESAERLPASSNNYEFTAVDLDGDGYLDLVTINDGPAGELGFPERVLRNDGTGTFEDVTEAWWPPASNRGWDDNVAVALDVDSDGDADLLIGSLDGPDRLLLNDGSGNLTLEADVFDGPETAGTLFIAVADLDGDGRPDVVEAQGEVPGHESERIHLGNPDVLPPDTAPPIIRASPHAGALYARVHDNRTPNLPHDWKMVVARWDGGEAPMTWYGENLFRAAVPDGAGGLEVCAVDAAGNEACAPSTAGG